MVILMAYNISRENDSLILTEQISNFLYKIIIDESGLMNFYTKYLGQDEIMQAIFNNDIISDMDIDEIRAILKLASNYLNIKDYNYKVKFEKYNEDNKIKLIRRYDNGNVIIFVYKDGYIEFYNNRESGINSLHIKD
jgi:hypothetical protein